MTESIIDRPILTRKPAGRGIPLFANEPRTLSGLFVQAVTKHNRPDALNFKSGGIWKPISSDELLERIGNIALGLYSLGISDVNQPHQGSSAASLLPG